MSDIRDRLLDNYYGEHYRRIMKNRKKKLVKYSGGRKEVVDIVSVGQQVRIWDDVNLRRSYKRGKVKSFDDRTGSVVVDFDGQDKTVDATLVSVE